MTLSAKEFPGDGTTYTIIISADPNKTEADRGGTVIIKTTEKYPDAYIANLKGKKLNKVVESDLISDDIRITHAEQTASQLKLRIKMDTLPVKK